MGVGARLGGTYEDAICPVCFRHNYGYYRDLAGLGKSLVRRLVKKVHFVKWSERSQRRYCTGKRSKTYKNCIETYKSCRETDAKSSNILKVLHVHKCTRYKSTGG